MSGDNATAVDARVFGYASGNCNQSIRRVGKAVRWMVKRLPDVEVLVEIHTDEKLLPTRLPARKIGCFDDALFDCTLVSCKRVVSLIDTGLHASGGLFDNGSVLSPDLATVVSHEVFGFGLNPGEGRLSVIQFRKVKPSVTR